MSHEETTLAAQLAKECADRFGLEYDRYRTLYFKIFKKGDKEVKVMFTINILAMVEAEGNHEVIQSQLDEAQQSLRNVYVDEGKKDMVEV